ncbi:MAG TPA: GNAT family N-acetyltransferase [Actinomycetaceae bacterium]|nr:GNAT family N-acetyltransferase [Actinomycetaceae bacterium]
MTEPRFGMLTIADAGELLTVRRAAFVTEAQLYGNPHLPALTQSLEELIEDMEREDVVTIGAWIGHRLVGSLRIEFEGVRANLGRLAVAPDLQGRGIGSRLVMEVLEYLPEETSEVWVFTAEDSGMNVAVYERQEAEQEPSGERDLTYEYLRRLLGEDGSEIDENDG